jgi:uncharacterized membrane protein (DUF485 family)
MNKIWISLMMVMFASTDAAARKTPPEFQQWLDQIASRPWQNFWTLIFLIVSYTFIIVRTFRAAFLRDDISNSYKARAIIVFGVFAIVVPLTFISIGLPVSDLWQTLLQPLK